MVLAMRNVKYAGAWRSEFRHLFRDSAESNLSRNKETKPAKPRFFRSVESATERPSKQKAKDIAWLVASLNLARAISDIIQTANHTSGFDWNHSALSDILNGKDSGRFSVDVIFCSASMATFAYLLRKDSRSMINDIGRMAMAVSAVSLTGVSARDGPIAKRHRLLAMIFFTGAPISLEMIGIDKFSSGSRVSGALDIAAGLAAVIPCIAGYNKHDSTMPPLTASYEAASVIALTVWPIARLAGRNLDQASRRTT